MAFYPRGVTDPRLFAGINYYHAAGRLPSPGRRYGYICYCLSLLALSYAFTKHSWSTALSGDQKLSRWFLCSLFACLVVVEFIFRKDIVWSCLAGALFAVFIYFRPQILKSNATFAVAAFCCSSLLLIDLYALTCITPNLYRFEKWPEAIVEIELHCAYILCNPADRLASGLPLFEKVASVYGVISQTILALVQKSFGLVSWGAVVKGLGAMHILFICGASCAYFKYAKKNKALACLATLILIPYLPVVGTPVLYPHISAIRCYGFLIASIFLLFVAPRQTNAWLGIGAGFVSGFCLLNNLESGVAVSLGIGLYVLLRNAKLFFPSPKKIGAAASAFLLGLCGAILIFEIVIAISFGYVISLSAWVSHARDMLYLAFSGINSMSDFGLFLLPLVITVHCSYVLVTSLGRLGVNSDPGDVARVSLCAMNLIWLLYFFNSPLQECIYANLFLYLFLFIDLLKTLTLERLLARKRWLRLCLLTVVMILASEAMSKMHAFAKDIQWENVDADTAKQSRIMTGILFSSSMAEELKTRADYLKKQRAKSLCYLTMNSILMSRLSGVQPDLPMDDIFFTFKRFSENIQFVDDLANRKVKTVLIDAPDLKMQGAATVKLCLDLYRLLLKKHYTLVQTIDGWQVWSLNESKN